MLIVLVCFSVLFVVAFVVVGCSFVVWVCRLWFTWVLLFIWFWIGVWFCFACLFLMLGFVYWLRFRDALILISLCRFSLVFYCCVVTVFVGCVGNLLCWLFVFGVVLVWFDLLLRFAYILLRCC